MEILYTIDAWLIAALVTAMLIGATLEITNWLIDKGPK